MSDNVTVIGDENMKEQIIHNSNMLGISVNELIDRYIRRGLFCDDYYEPPVYTLDELIEMGNKAVERDKKNGIPPKKHNFDVFVGILDSED